MRRTAEKQQAAASIEADKASVASAEAAAIEKDAEKELAQAEPAMKAAAEAVNCLSKTMLTELKSLPKPPAGVDKVPVEFEAVHILSGWLRNMRSTCRWDIVSLSVCLWRSNSRHFIFRVDGYAICKLDVVEVSFRFRCVSG